MKARPRGRKPESRLGRCSCRMKGHDALKATLYSAINIAGGSLLGVIKMKPKSKIVKHLDNLINQIPRLSKGNYIPHSEKYDFWKRRVELFLERVCGGKIAEEFKTIVKEESSPRFRWLRDEPFEQRFERERKENRLHCQVALLKARNLLKAVKEVIELFESEELKKESEVIKRKYKEWGIDFKFFKHKKGEEVETKGQ